MPDDQSKISDRLILLGVGIPTAVGAYFLILNTSHYIWGSLVGLVSGFFIAAFISGFFSNTKTGNLVALGLMFALAVGFIGYSINRSDNPTQEDRYAQLADKSRSEVERIRKEIAGDNQTKKDQLLDTKVTAEEYLKTNLRDPSSLEIVSETADFSPTDPQRAYIIVRIKYRAKNGFGGTNLNEKIFRFNDKLLLKSVS